MHNERFVVGVDIVKGENGNVRVGIVQNVLNELVDASSITIVNQKVADGDEYYIWEIRCPRSEYKKLTWRLLDTEGLQSEDLVFADLNKREEA